MASSSVASLKRKQGLVSSRLTPVIPPRKEDDDKRQAPRQVSPSLPELETDSSFSYSNDTYESSSSASSISFFSCSSLESLSSDDDSVSSQHETSTTTLTLKQTSKWHFRVGEHADKRSYGDATSSNSRRWMPQNFDLMEDAIGNGAFGVVHMAHDFTSNKNVALKIIPKRTVLKNGSIQNVRAEVEIQTRHVYCIEKIWNETKSLFCSHFPLVSFCSLNHERIVKCFGYFERKESITLVLEYAAHGNLRAYMKDCKDEKIPIAQVQCLIRQVTSALSHLESRYVAHRDVKSENVLITKHDGRNLEVKLCDFGYATKYTLDDDMQRTMVGTPEFIPPEMILDAEYMARHVDPWALGVLAYELALGRSPFYVATREMKQIAKERYYEKSYHVIYDLIVNFTVLERPCECENDEFFEFVRCLLQLEPFDRWSATEALGHSWLQSEAEEERAMKRIKVKISEAV
jgi:hypothetical protein